MAQTDKIKINLHSSLLSIKTITLSITVALILQTLPTQVYADDFDLTRLEITAPTISSKENSPAHGDATVDWRPQNGDWCRGAQILKVSIPL